MHEIFACRRDIAGKRYLVYFKFTEGSSKDFKEIEILESEMTSAEDAQEAKTLAEAKVSTLYSSWVESLQNSSKRVNLKGDPL